MREACVPKETSFEWNPEEKRVGFGGLPCGMWWDFWVSPSSTWWHRTGRSLPFRIPTTATETRDYWSSATCRSTTRPAEVVAGSRVQGPTPCAKSLLADVAISASSSGEATTPLRSTAPSLFLITHAAPGGVIASSCVGENASCSKALPSTPAVFSADARDRITGAAVRRDWRIRSSLNACTSARFSRSALCSPGARAAREPVLRLHQRALRQLAKGATPDATRTLSAFCAKVCSGTPRSASADPADAR